MKRKRKKNPKHSYNCSFYEDLIRVGIVQRGINGFMKVSGVMYYFTIPLGNAQEMFEM